MRRIKQERYALQMQIANAAHGIGEEPDWPSGAPTQIEVQAVADDLDDLLTQLVAAENQIAGVRAMIQQKSADGVALLRRIDNVTSALYGVDGAKKGLFGLRPIDTTRNSPGPTPQVIGLKLTDGLAPGSIQADWKRIPRAVYEVQWFADEALERIMGSAVSTRSELLIPALTPGTQIWVRVRALRGRKQGDWSAVGTRIANL